MKKLPLATAALLLTLAPHVAAQSSSLYLEPEVRARRNDPAPARVSVEEPSRLNPAILAWSHTAVPIPEPRQFQINDLITIIVREATESDWEATNETSKSTGFNGSLSALPKISLADFALRSGGISDPIDAKFDWDNDFKGDGQQTRSETITARIQAKIIDVKPNGVLSVEAHKYNQVDDETLTLTLTGMCRVEDVTADNTVLSTQVYDLNLQKTHTGDLRKTTKKGIFTKIFETLFNF